MKKIVGILLITTLILGLVGNAFAANVSTAMYGDEKAASSSMTGNQVSTALTNAGVSDVKADDWAAGSIAVMVQQGFMAPNSKGEINPEEPVAANTAVSVLAKVLGLAGKNDSTQQAVIKARESGLSTSASGDMSRLDAAKLIAKALNITPKAGGSAFTDTGALSASDKGLLAALYDAGVFKGCGNNTFKPDEKLTAAQLAALLDRILGAKK